MTMNKIAFRMDDIGASSKKWEVYGKGFFQAGNLKVRIPLVTNFLFLKYLSVFKGRGPYRELNKNDWQRIFAILKKHKASMTIGITACWVERDGSLIPFPEKFPKEAGILKKGLREGLIEIANHGLTHCVIGKHLPRLFKGNRKYHREFWPWLPENTHQEHIERSQQILENYFGQKVITFIPPGNVWNQKTERHASRYGIKYLSSTADLAPNGEISNGVKYISGENVFAFHDREVVLYGTNWLKKSIERYLSRKKQICTIKELGKYG